VGSYPTFSALPVETGGLFSVALSLGLPRPAVNRRHFFLESGLSSPDSVQLPSHPHTPMLIMKNRRNNQETTRLDDFGRLLTSRQSYKLTHRSHASNIVYKMFAGFLKQQYILNL